MNYHTLADFRLAHGALLQRLLAAGVAAPRVKPVG
jgi:hypothetical protein